MSMKVPNAYRLNDCVDPQPVLWRIEDKAKELAKERLRAHYEELVIEMDPELPEYQAERAKCPNSPEHMFRLARARHQVQDGYKAQLGAFHFDTYSLDVSVGIYPHEGDLYLRTFAEAGSIFGGLLDFVGDEHTVLTDFHFTDQVDRPRSITESDWEHRRKVWNAIYAGRRPRVLALDIVTWHTFVDVDPWRDMGCAWSKTGFELPIREEVWARRLRKHGTLGNVRADDGIIEADPVMFAARAHDGRWLSVVRGSEHVHDTLDQAGERLNFEALLPSQRRMIVAFMQTGGAKLPAWIEPPTPG